MFDIYDQPCKNCLLSKERIVSPKEAKRVIAECVEHQTHFVCHKSSMEGGDVCCHSFYKKFRSKIAKIQIFERLNLITFKKQPAAEPLTPYQKFAKK
jgi:hypothetical protein